MNNLVYNDIVSCFFFLVSVYFAIKYVKKHTIKYALLSSICLSIGNFLRSVGIIFLLAIIIYIIISRLNLRKIIHFILLAVVIINIPFNATSFILQKKGVIKEPLGISSAPALMWVNMSIGKDTFGYWDGGESYKIYLSDCKGNKEASEKVFKEKIKQKVKEMGILGFTEMYFKKSLWLWTEGTYQCLYYGMSHTQPGGYSYEIPVSKFFVENLKRREYINWILYATNYLINIVILIALIMSIRKNKYKFSLFVIIILGFIGFYLLWETKPRYIYLCYPYLILLSYASLRKVFSCFESIVKNKFSEKFN